MRTERTEKIMATKAAKAEHFKTQQIQINDDWRIIRADEHNWEVQFQGRFDGYYGKLRHALVAVADKILDREALNSIADVQRCYRHLCEQVEAAANRAQFSS